LLVDVGGGVAHSVLVLVANFFLRLLSRINLAILNS
jgi:hypothetical protein